MNDVTYAPVYWFWAPPPPVVQTPPVPPPPPAPCVACDALTALAGDKRRCWRHV